LQTFYPHSVTY